MPCGRQYNPHPSTVMNSFPCWLRSMCSWVAVLILTLGKSCCVCNWTHFALWKWRPLVLYSLRSYNLQPNVIRSLGETVSAVTPTFRSWFLDLGILAWTETTTDVACIEGKYTMLRTFSDAARQCDPVCTISGSVRGNSTTFSSYVLEIVENMYQICEFHGHGSIATFLFLYSEFLIQKKRCVQHHDGQWWVL